MNLQDVMQQLDALGCAQTRKIWRRHGAAEPLFGVKFADLGKLQNRIKTDQALAGALWQTGNHDARLLACMIANPSQITPEELQRWAEETKDSGTAEALANVASQSPAAASLCAEWLKPPGAHARLPRVGWSMVAHAAKAEALTDVTALAYLQRIEAEIHSAENWTRRTMIYALIAIACLNATLRAAAEAASNRIGAVRFDPGDTACEFPDARTSIAKVWARKKA
jgi:3-methyladenine DNA glycosylase AlkD